MVEITLGKDMSFSNPIRTNPHELSKLGEFCIYILRMFFLYLGQNLMDCNV